MFDKDSQKNTDQNLNNSFGVDQDFQIDTQFTGVKPAEKAEEKKKKPALSRGAKLAILSTLGLLALVLIFSTFVFFSSQSGSESSVLGVGSSLTNFILLGAGILFVVIGLLSLIVFLNSTFKFMTVKTEESGKKKTYFRRLIVSLISLIVSSLLAVLLLSFSGNDFGGGQEVSGIVTDPVQTIGLSAPVKIQFDGTKVPFDNTQFTVVSYQWSFGDGNTATGPQVEHEFLRKPETGFYETVLTLNLENQAGEIERLQVKRTIGIENEKVVPVIKVSEERGRAPLTVSFDASESVDPDGQIVSYEWDFNDDGVAEATGTSAEFEFTEMGEYEVKLFLTDSNGETVIGSKTISILNEDIINGVITNSPEDEILAPERSYTFDASESVSDEGNIENFEWDFGDGVIRQGAQVSYTFENEGIYTVSLRMNDEKGNENTITKEYIVSNSPSGLFANIQTTPELAEGAEALVGITPFRVNFTAGHSSATDEEITEYKWDFDNDGTVDASGQNVEHVFVDPGSFTTNLSIISATGKTAVKQLQVEVGGSALKPIVSAEPTVGQVPLTVEFDATATKEPADSNIVSFRWDFGDGTPIKRGLPIMTHRYDRVGDFKVTVTAITDTNEIASSEVLVFVNPIPLQACFEQSRETGSAPLTITFDPSCSTGPASKFNWDFGNGDTSIERKPVYTFTESGTYEVELEVVSVDNGVSTFKNTIVVE